MALIKQIRVGGTTYDVATRAGYGIEIGTSGEVSVKCSSGLRADPSGLSVLISGYGDGITQGLAYSSNNVISVKLASGLKFNDLGYIQVDMGSGLTQDREGRICVVNG